MKNIISHHVSQRAHLMVMMASALVQGHYLNT